jgi:phage gpG-like protein
MPIELKIQADYKQAQAAIAAALRNVQNIRPVWREFANEYKEIIDANWGTRGKVMMRSGWPKLAASTLKYKRKKYPGKRILERTGELRDRALTPKAVARNQKLYLEWDLPTYWKYHQQPGAKGSKIPQRAFLWYENNTLPKQALRVLLDLLQRHMKKGVK